MGKSCEGISIQESRKKGMKMIGSLDKFKADMEAGVRGLTCGGKCAKCGECCTDSLPLSSKEIKRIRNYIKANNIKPVNHIPAVLNTPTLDLVCPFLNSEKQCNIYPVRPEICKQFTCHNWDKTFHVNNIMDYKGVSVRATFFPNERG